MVLLAGAALGAVAWAGAALFAISALHHLYFDRRNVPDLEAFTRFEFPTIGHVYDTNGQPLIELARENRQITQYADIPWIVRDAILATEDKRFFSHNGVDYLSIPRVLASHTTWRGMLLRRSSLTWRRASSPLVPINPARLGSPALRVHYSDDLVG